MPELPETEVVRRDLEREIVGRRIKDAEIRPGSNSMKIVKRHGRRKEFQELLAGAKVDNVHRLGTRILLDMDNARVLVLHLGTGGLLLKSSAADGFAAHTRVVITFTVGGQLRLVDPKLSGEVFVAPKDDVAGMEELHGFSIDPLETPLAWPQFSSLLEKRQTTMKELLTDERFICGLGDIYSDEVLFAAGIRYDRSSDKLSSQDVRRLYRSLMEILMDAVKARGTTWAGHDFRDLQGNPGQFQLELKVFEREGEACRRCRSHILRAGVNGGYTFFCPQCQS